MMIEFETEWVRQNSPDPADPTLINWAERQSEAWIPFKVIDGRPFVPLGAPSDDGLNSIKVAYGRNDMRLWGENKMADALVTCMFNGMRYVLLVERADGLGWAMPGGGVESHEKPLWAAVRELREETGLALTTDQFTPDAPRWVPDPRGSMEAWAVTVVARCGLGAVDALPEVRGGSDARDATWILIDELDRASEHIFPAHREILGALR